MQQFFYYAFIALLLFAMIGNGTFGAAVTGIGDAFRSVGSGFRPVVQGIG